MSEYENINLNAPYDVMILFQVTVTTIRCSCVRGFFFQERIGACFERRILFLIKISSLSYTEYQKYLTYFTLNILPIRPKSLPFVKTFMLQSCSI